jgi:hypothetical protein
MRVEKLCVRSMDGRWPAGKHLPLLSGPSDCGVTER